MTIDLYQPPYYDDYYDSVSETGTPVHSKGFNQILFKPGYAVQARELTQLQTILKNQIAQFGSNIFKHGSIVIPGNSYYELNLCFVRIPNLTYNASVFEDKYVVSSNGLRAYVKKVVTSGSIAYLYVQYTNMGTSDERIFVANEVLTTLDGITNITIDTDIATPSVGPASLAYITPGVFFVNGSFVSVNKHAVVIDHSSIPTKSVRLQISEEIIDSNEDSTLLDPSQGTSNYSAPGADRVALRLTLVSVDPDAELTSSFIELMRFETGVLKEHMRYSKYNELEKFMARRTYDESGNYVVSGLNVDVREHLRSGVNGGVYDAAAGGDASKLAVNISAGKAYVSGFELDKISNTIIEVDKSRDTVTDVSNSIPAYAQYFYVSGFQDGLPNVHARESLTLYDGFTTGAAVGTAKVLALDLHESFTPTSKSVYKLLVSNLSLNNGVSLLNIGKITLTSGVDCKVLQKYTVIPSAAIDYTSTYFVRSGLKQAVVHGYLGELRTLYVYRDTNALAMPSINDIISEWTLSSGGSATGATGKINSLATLVKNKESNLLIDINSPSVKSTTDADGNVDMSYKIYRRFAVSSDGSGVINISVTGMTIDPVEQGNIVIFDINEATLYSSSSATNVDSTNLTILIPGAPSHNFNVIISCTKSGINARPKTKTLLTATESVTAASLITLANADGVEIVSIEQGAVDYTNSFTFSGGQTDYTYEKSYLTYIPNMPSPVGLIDVEYTYFRHNANTGDYFSIDSYELSGLVDYFASSALTYRSSDTSEIFDLGRCLDFRTNSDDAIAYVPSLDSRITTSIQKYVARIDSVVCGVDNNIFITKGQPAVTPTSPYVPPGYLHLADLYIPPYTVNSSQVKVDKKNNRVYTMRDVGVIDRRITEIEKYVTLTQLENTSVNYDIIDTSTGLSRFKSGYLIDSFKDIDVIADALNEDFKVSYVSESVVPQFEYFVSNLAPTATGLSEVMLSGDEYGFLSLPYTEKVFASQPLSSRVTNINPFAVVSWVGAMTIIPAMDYWVEVIDLPNIINNFQQNIVFDTWTGRTTISAPFPVPATPQVSALNRALNWGVFPATLNNPWPTATLPPQKNPITLEMARNLTV